MDNLARRQKIRTVETPIGVRDQEFACRAYLIAAQTTMKGDSKFVKAPAQLHQARDFSVEIVLRAAHTLYRFRVENNFGITFDLRHRIFRNGVAQIYTAGLAGSINCDFTCGITGARINADGSALQREVVALAKSSLHASA